MSRVHPAAAVSLLMILVACSDSGTSTGSGGAGGGASSTGGSGGEGVGGSAGGEACFAPTDRLPLGVSACAALMPGEALDGTAEGDVSLTGSGFVVNDPLGAIVVDGATTSIPAGTLVRVSYKCAPGFYGDPGQSVHVTNLPTIGMTTNPTEAGTRLWYFAGGGGETWFTDDFPLTVDDETKCMDGTIEDGFRSPSTLILGGPGDETSIDPGQTATHTESAGAHAGNYTVSNVNVTFIGHAGGDAASEFNVEIVRAP